MADCLYIQICRGKDATATIETTVAMKQLSKANCTVYSYITDRDGKKIGQAKEQPLSLAVNGKGTIIQKIKMSNARLVVTG